MLLIKPTKTDTSGINHYIQAFNNHKFWRKIHVNAFEIGFKGLSRSIELYHLLSKHDIPITNKTIILAALGYVLAPIDAIPDILPLGFADDLAVLAIAYNNCKKYITLTDHDKAYNTTKRILRRIKLK